MTAEYKHTQIAYVMIYIIGAVLAANILLIAILSIKLDIEPAWLLPVIGTSVIVPLSGCLLVFYKLTVEIKDGFLRFWFGPGLIRKKIALDEIISCNPVKNRWWYGYGIHFTPYGTLYNVSGPDAVQIEMKSGKKLRLGTDEPEKLADAINAALR